MIKFLFTILLNVIGIGILIVVIVVPTLPQFKNDRRVDSALGIVLCNPGERVVRQVSNHPVFSRVGIVVTPSCVNRGGQSRDVTMRWLLIGFGGFGFIMLFGIVLDIMLLLNTFRRAVTHMATTRNTSPPFPTIPTMTPSDDIELSLSHKLKQLKEVRLSGSITDDEYDRLR